MYFKCTCNVLKVFLLCTFNVPARVCRIIRSTCQSDVQLGSFPPDSKPLSRHYRAEVPLKHCPFSDNNYISKGDAA